MTAKTKAQIKAFFETGDKPTESQFIDFIDSYVDKSGPMGQIETAASAGNTGFAFCSGGRGEVLGLGAARDAMGITVYTTAMVTQLLGSSFLTTAGASAVAADTIRSAVASTVQAVSGQATGLVMDPVLVRNSIEGNRAQGQVIQSIRVTSFTGGISSLTTNIPEDNSTPLIAEGTELFTATITPSSATSIIRVSGFIYGTSGLNINVLAAGFRSSTNIGVSYQFNPASQDIPVHFQFYDAPGTASTLTYSLRGGVTSGRTLSLNTSSSGNFGGALISYMLVEEIKA